MDKEEEISGRTGLEIAVIGMACRFPGARNVEQFWENLKNGVESITFFSDDELIESGVGQEFLKNPNYVKAKGFLEHCDEFDSSFFGYSPKEAEIMNPQLRLFHECTWEAIENSGYNPDNFKGLIALYAGGYSSSLWEAFAAITGKVQRMGAFQASFLTNKDYLASRVSYNLNLKGPSVSLNTACSTSLVAIHLAVQGLLTGECDLALAGGTVVSIPHKGGYLSQEGMVMSPDGHCRAFDAEAKGFVNGNGVGLVVLKRLTEAVEAGDFIYAIICGSAVNNDGSRKVGYTAPSVEGQVEVIRAAQQMAGVKPESIGYIEAHGTGTNLGDPIEIEALKKVFVTEKKSFCGIGSVKTNIGHLDAAAGVAGFIKTVLALNHKFIPPSLNYAIPNPGIDFIDSPFYVNNMPAKWENEEYPLRAGISSFAIGGTNAHIVLEDAHSVRKKTISPSSRKLRFVLLSAKKEAVLNRMTKNLTGFLKENPAVDFDDVVYTLQVGRKSFKYRRFFVTPGFDNTLAILTAYDLQQVHTAIAPADPKPVIFIFSEGIPTDFEKAEELYREEPIFREACDHCLSCLRSCRDAGIPFPHKFAGEIETPFAQAKVSPILMTFIFRYSLAKLLIELGIEPQAMIADSTGEYAAAHLAGVFSLEDALKLLAYREICLKTPLPEESIDPESFGNRFKEEFKSLTLNEPEIPYISSIKSDWVDYESISDPCYWLDRPGTGIPIGHRCLHLVNEQETIFIKLGTGLEQPGSPTINVVQEVEQNESFHEHLLTQIGKLWLLGHEIDWERFYTGEERRRIPLPTYPFAGDVYRIDTTLLDLLLDSHSKNLQEILKRTEVPVNEVRQAGVSNPALSQRPELKTGYVTPANQAEKKLVEIWEELFGFHPIGIRDNFFELGGDSLKGITFVNRYQELLEEIVHVSAVFEAPTIAELVEYFKRHYPEGYSRISGEEPGSETTHGQKKLGDNDIEEVRQVLAAIPIANKVENPVNSKALFILSAPRTGSTLIRVILAAHSHLFAPPELNLLSFADLAERKKAYSGNANTFLHGTLRAIMKLKNCTVERAEEIMREFEEKGMSTQDFYRQLCDWAGDRLIVDKSTGYALNPWHLKRAETYFQNPYYIHLVRNPYGMVRSYEEAKMDLLMDAELRKQIPYNRKQMGELNWTICNRNIMDFLKEIPGERKTFVRFEDLVREPEERVRGLCRFLEIPFEAELLQPYKEKKKRMTDGAYPGGMMVGDMKFHQHKSIAPEIADAWQKHYRFDFLANMTLQIAESYGYNRIHESSDVLLTDNIKKIDPGNAQQMLSAIDQLSDEEVDIYLKEKLSKLERNIK